MVRRRDAGFELVRFLRMIDQRFPEICGPRSVWTTGRIDLDPGEKSIIPGRAEALFQLRDADPGRARPLGVRSLPSRASGQRGRALQAGGRATEREHARPDGRGAPGGVHRAAARRASGKHTRMPSGAGHDAQWLARKLPAPCCSCPRSAASAITGRRTPATRTLCVVGSAAGSKTRTGIRPSGVTSSSVVVACIRSAQRQPWRPALGRRKCLLDDCGRDHRIGKRAGHRARPCAAH